jgi:hypothetical protein
MANPNPFDAGGGGDTFTTPTVQITGTPPTTPTMLQKVKAQLGTKRKGLPTWVWGGGAIAAIAALVTPRKK